MIDSSTVAIYSLRTMKANLAKARRVYDEEGFGSLVEKVARHSATATLDRGRYVYDHVTTPIRSTYLFEEEWDLAIILDGCRYDLARDRIASHDIDLNQPEAVYSPGCCTVEWLERTFNAASDETLAGTTYITANPHMDRISQHKLSHIEKLHLYAWDPELGTVPPRPVTDETIRLMRRDSANRYLVHYMQPHLPPLDPSKEYAYRWEPTEQNRRILTEPHDPWKTAREGKYPDTVVRDYRSNLDPVLDEVQLLLKNVDASKVVITSDHGQYLGEDGRWGHEGKNHTHWAVRKVPWIETSAEDSYTHTPAEYDKTHVADRTEQLKALGYV